MDECLTEYFPKTAYVDFYKYTELVAKRGTSLIPRVDLWTSTSDLTDLTMWHSKWNDGQMFEEMNSSLKPHQPGDDKNRAGSMAMWVAPIRVYITFLEKIHFILLSIINDVPFRETVGSSQPLVIYIRYTQEKWVVGHVWARLQDVLVEPSVFASRDTLSAGGPIPCHVGNPISNKHPAVFDFILYI